jgi:hypothetical protein
MTMDSKHTPGPWKSEYDDNGFFFVTGTGAPSPYIAATGGEGDADHANAELIAAAPELLVVAKNAAATIGAIYEWLERVEARGGATNIEGVAACQAMLNSLRRNAARNEALIMAPLRAALEKAGALPKPEART